MCLILFAYQAHPVYKLIVAANRDEFLQRPTAPIHFWEDEPTLLAGRDLEKMGTWMGVTTFGRFAALTNYREPNEMVEGKQSRGKLVKDALTYNGAIAEYMKQLEKTNSQYPGYNLLVGELDNLYYYSNVGKSVKKVKPGIHGLSNHLLDTNWPKVKKGKEGLSTILKGDDLVENLLELLQNTDRPHDNFLPNTGVSLEWERILSSLFIQTIGYGTRSSTVLLMSDKEIQYVERTYSGSGSSNQTFCFPIKE
ncbi:NRDE family protein [Bacillus timonensis]|uniref:NRDE family protein n=1 Tax=Bacillus timonensis TaxID=1033734 RepID=A0A4S3PVJ3_9BACI|nr:NRDE family protein [Bacillus timonensis]THE13840.1 NRDE family protein [Bacillus timonensis]